MRLSPRVLPLALAAVAATFACQAPGTQAPPDPAAELRQSAAALGSVHTVQADARFGPGVVYQGFTVQSAKVAISLPHDSDATIKVRQQDFLVDIRVIVTGGNVYLQVPFARVQQVPPAQAAELPDLARLFDPATGLPAIMARGTGTAANGREKVGDVDCDRITTTYTADQISQALNGLKPGGDIKATIWVARDDHRPRRVLLEGPLLDPSSPTSVDVTLHDYDAPVTIATPAVS